MSEFSPVIIFVYKRVDHLKKTINSLSKNKLSKKTDLYIFSDGPKFNCELRDVDKVRNFCTKINGFKSVTVFKRKENIGLSRNVVQGVTKILKQKKNAIFLEDDMQCDKYFLDYMNFYLKKFKNENKIACIHGYNYPIKKSKKIPSHFFIKGADCWGWATWSNRWKIYNDNGKYLAEKIKKTKLIKEFNFNNTFNYYQMLLNCINRKNDSWAIKWYASAFLKNKLSLYPKHSLINNIGMDGTGRHSSTTNVFYTKLKHKKIEFNGKIPIVENIAAKNQIEVFFKSIEKNLYQKILIKLKKNVFNT